MNYIRPFFAICKRLKNKNLQKPLKYTYFSGNQQFAEFPFFWHKSFHEHGKTATTAKLPQLRFRMFHADCLRAGLPLFFPPTAKRQPKNQRLPGIYESSFAVIVQQMNVSTAMQGIAR